MPSANDATPSHVLHKKEDVQAMLDLLQARQCAPTLFYCLAEPVSLTDFAKDANVRSFTFLMAQGRVYP